MRSEGTSEGGGIGVGENTEYKGALSSKRTCARVPYSQLVNRRGTVGELILLYI